jgi:tRNA(fMet)-specific endonuclease VapC
MVTYLLDTNTCIRYLTGRSESVLNRIKSLRPVQIRLCSIVRSELAYGAWKSSHPLENFSRQMTFCNRFISLPFDDRAAEECGRIRAELSISGLLIGSWDLQIAAIALVNNTTLVTHNTGEFARISGLTLEDWELHNN